MLKQQRRVFGQFPAVIHSLLLIPTWKQVLAPYVWDLMLIPWNVFHPCDVTAAQFDPQYDPLN